MPPFSLPEIPKAVWEAAAKAKEMNEVDNKAEAAKKAEAVKKQTGDKLRQAQQVAFERGLEAVGTPAGLRERILQDAIVRLRSINNVHGNNQTLLKPHLPLLMSVSGRQEQPIGTRVQTILQRLQARPPQPPPQLPPPIGWTPDPAIDGAERYFTVINERQNPNIQQPTFGIRTNVVNIRDDQNYIELLMQQFQKSQRPDIVNALRATWNALDQYARTDLAAYIAATRSPTVMGEGLRNMGTILGGAALAVYMLASGTLDLASGKMPLMAILAGGGIYALGSERFRNSMFGRQDRLILEDISSVLNSTVFQRFSRPPEQGGYGIMRNGPQWEVVFETLMDSRNNQARQSFLARLHAGTLSPRHPDFTGELVAVTGAPANSDVLRQLTSMTRQRTVNNQKTDFECFVELLSQTRHEGANREILQFVRTGSVQAPPKSPSKAPPKDPPNMP